MVLSGGSQLCVVSVTKCVLVMYNNCCSVSVGGSQQFCEGGSQLCVVCDKVSWSCIITVAVCRWEDLSGSVRGVVRYVLCL